MSLKKMFRTYHTLTEEQCMMLNLKYQNCTVQYSEEARSDWKSLVAETAGTSSDNCYILAASDDWNPDTCDIRVRQDFSLEHLNNLFAASENAFMAVALTDDVLGVAAIWWSDKTNLRGTEEIGEIRWSNICNNGHQDFSFKKTFSAGDLAGKLEVRYIIYMKQPGWGSKPGFAHESGVLLAALSSPLTLLIDGDGASFPVSTVDEPGKPLWWTEIHIDDPMENTFTEEYFCLIINRKHPGYKDLGKDTSYDTAFYRDVFAGTLEELFITLYLESEDGNDLKQVPRASLIPGTIAYVAEYMRDVFHIETESISAIHNSVRQAVDNKLLRGESA